MFTLAHLSDPHLPMPQARPVQLLNKRATGYYNWWRHRVHLHVPEALAGIVADIKAQRPDHIALTGDLVNVALPQEFRRAAEWLAAFDTPDRITVIPGNHDAYVPMPWAEGIGPVGRLYGGRRPAAGGGLRRLPDPAPARRHRADRPVDRRAQAAAAGDRRSRARRRSRAPRRLLGETGREGLCRDRADPSSAAHRPVALEASHRCRCLPGDDPPGRLRGDPARPQSPQRDRAHRRPDGRGAGAGRHLGVGGARAASTAARAII